MGFGAVAFVAVKAVMRIFFMVLEHHPVSGDLGDYGGRRYGKAFGVSFYYRFLTYADAVKAHRVQKQNIYSVSSPFGSQNMTLAPPSFLFSAFIIPSWALTMVIQTESPIPIFRLESLSFPSSD